MSLLALGIHLVPLFLPRELPEVDLRLASMMALPEHRLPYLEPLLENPQANAEHLRTAALLALPASRKLAARFLAQAQQRAPQEVVANQLLRARLCRADGEETCVAQAFAAARAAAPDDARPDLLEADFAEEDGHTAEALAALARATEKSPDDVELALRHARLLGANGRHAEAEAIFATLRGRLPELRLLIEHGLLELAQGETEEARRDFEAAVQVSPEDAEPHYYLGVTHFRGGDWPKAEAELREADRLSPQDFRPLALLCALQREEGRIDEAAGSRALLDRRLPDQRSQYDAACPP